LVGADDIVMVTIIYYFYYLINIFMVQFSFTPQQFYARTPQSNQDPVSNLFNGLTQNNYGNGGYYQNIAAYHNYNIYKQPVPGTIGYRLPAQNYYNYGQSNPAYYGTGTLKTQLVSTVINAGVNAIVDAFTGGTNNYYDPTNGRLNGTGVDVGAKPQQLLQASNTGSNTAWQDDVEDRVIIHDQTGKFIGQSDVFKPLQNTSGVLFPYTPQISVSHKASYDAVSLVHTNYTTPQYQHSSVDSISISAQFTANYPAEAEYVLAMIHFFRTATKMFYGKDQIAGTPPPVLYLDGYGPYTFDHIPVVITGFDYTMPNDVDYISCKVLNQHQKVPTSLTIQLSMIPTYSRNKISNEFGLVDFSQGTLVTKGNSARSGGFI
jgi:hypothetical protein